MKKLSVVMLLSTTSLIYAGGEFTPVTPYETEDEQLAIIEAVEEPPIVEEPVVVKETPPPIKEVPIPPPPVKVVEDEVNPSGFYAGLGITGVRYESSCTCPETSGTETNLAVAGRVGYDFNKFIGIEARGIKSVAGDDGASVSHVGLFVKPMMYLTEDANIYALIGAGKTSTSGDLQKVSAEGLALGAGIEFDLFKEKAKEGKYSRPFDGKGDQEKGIGLFIDYERLLVKEDSPDMDTISAGVTYDF